MSQGVSLAPLLPWPVIAAAVGVAAMLLTAALVRGGRGLVSRAAVIVVLAVALLNPRVVREDRHPQTDVAVIVVDESASQAVGRRPEQTRTALAALEAALAGYDGLEVTVVRGGGSRPGREADDGGTRLMAALDGALVEVPRERLAGAFLLTDGQVHDAAAGATTTDRPVHVLLTGSRREEDRRLVVERAPGYGLVGKPVTIAFRVEDRVGPGAAPPRRPVTVRIGRGGEDGETLTVPVGRPAQHTFVLDHAGPTVVVLEAEARPGELTTLNNRAVVAINGVRDRLRVLLVSGQPHPGERVWRSLLKADPAVDLVHFTILRPPEKDDFTPLQELALIVFPTRRLFEEKLSDFDLIVFDRYLVRNVLPVEYVANIADYVRNGGALLFAVGPEFAGPRSLSTTVLAEVLPATPTSRVLEGGFRPALTESGRRHPVTADLPPAPPWGRWFRVVETQPTAGVTLMQGTDEAPLVVLDRTVKGRVALVASDHVWLWARGFEGGGPHAELIRRLVHWLMREPDLEEESLRARVDGGKLVVERRSLAPDAVEATVIAPSGARTSVTLTPGDDGRAIASVRVEETGLYRIDDGVRTTLAAAGPANPRELEDLRATGDRLAPVADETGGGVAWLEDGLPDIRRTSPGRDTAGRGWMGLVRNDSFVVSGLLDVPLLPGAVVLLLVLGGLTVAWWREGR